jgi:hypothetical protein
MDRDTNLDGVREGMARINRAMVSDPEQPQYGVEARLDEQMHAITDLENVVGDLIRRLEPVLCPEISEENTGGPVAAPERLESRISNDIGEHTTRINDMRRALEYAIERLEV